MRRHQVPAVPSFAMISGGQVRDALHRREDEVVELVEATYLLHSDGGTVNPPSNILRFADRPASRSIALPASVGGVTQVDGVEWISTFPANPAAGLPQASGVLILNDPDTGYPFACLEASVITASRTAAMAASAAEWLTRGRGRVPRLGFFGAGRIARHIHSYLNAEGWAFDETGIYDASDERATGFRGQLDRTVDIGKIVVHPSPESLIRSSDLLVVATDAGRPQVEDLSWFDHHPVVLHMSRRDLAPEILLGSTNVVDDVKLCLTADMSPQLAEQRIGNRDFLAGTLADVIDGRVSPPADHTVVFSPYGLGVLDVAVGKYVYDRILDLGELLVIDDFFQGLDRPGRVS